MAPCANRGGRNGAGATATTTQKAGAADIGQDSGGSQPEGILPMRPMFTAIIMPGDRFVGTLVDTEHGVTPLIEVHPRLTHDVYLHFSPLMSVDERVAVLRQLADAASSLAAELEQRNEVAA